MLKKRILFLLEFAFIILTVILFSSCGHARPLDTTSDKPVEGTTGEDYAEWRPEISKPWNFTPVISRNNGDSDIEVTLEQSVFTEMPETLVYTMTNKTGKPFYCLMSVYCEKQYLASEVGDSGALAGDFSFWVRIPFYRYASSIGWVETAKSSLDWHLTVSACTKENFEFTPGKYRLVTFADDGPHYAYFEITE